MTVQLPSVNRQIVDQFFVVWLACLGREILTKCEDRATSADAHPALGPTAQTSLLLAEKGSKAYAAAVELGLTAAINSAREQVGGTECRLTLIMKDRVCDDNDLNLNTDLSRVGIVFLFSSRGIARLR